MHCCMLDYTETLFLFVHYVSLQLLQATCGAIYGVVPFTSRRSCGLACGLVSAGGAIGGVINQGIFFLNTPTVGPYCKPPPLCIYSCISQVCCQLTRRSHGVAHAFFVLIIQTCLQSVCSLPDCVNFAISAYPSCTAPPLTEHRSQQKLRPIFLCFGHTLDCFRRNPVCF